MTRGLFLSHDGIGSSIFESQVATHVVEMSQRGVILDLLVYEVFRKAFALSEKNAAIISAKYPAVNITLMSAVNVYLPLAAMFNAFIFMFFIIKRRRDYSFIHARSDYSAFVALLTKPFHRLDVIWDCRGDSQNELEFSLSKKSIFLKMTLGAYLCFANKMIVKFVKRFSTGSIFVSDALRSLHQTGLQARKCIVVPCTVPETLFYFDKTLRNEFREKMGYSENDDVFLYSGSMVKYQGIELASVFFENILKMSERAKILVLTTQVEDARFLFNGLDSNRILIKSCTFAEVNAHYNSADFAVLFRDKYSLNYVASPTKFGEYCMVGLPVIMNNTVKQAYDYSIQIGNHVDMNTNSFSPVDDSCREVFSQNAKTLYSRKSYNSCYLDLYFSFS